MHSFQLRLCLYLLLLALIQCGDEDNSASEGSPSYPAKAKLASTSLSLTTTESQLTAGNASCTAGKSCLTPNEVGGQVMSVGFTAGIQGEFQGYLINPIGPNDPSSAPAGSGTQDFALSQGTELSGSYACCGGSSYPAGDQVKALRFQINFDYIDTSFALASGALAGTHTIRVMYTNKTLTDGTVAMKGDKLYKNADGFRFCSATSCDLTVRSQTTLVDAVAQTRSGSNPNYAFFSVNITEPFSFTQAEAEQGNWLFQLDFDVSNGAVFDADPTTYTAVAEMVAGFTVNSKPGDLSESGESGFSVQATKVQIP